MTRFLVRFSAFAVCLGCLLTACSTPANRTPEAKAPVPREPSAREQVEALLARMTLEEKVGQIMVIGFDAANFDAGLREMIEKYHVGGVIFFARNIESPAQLARLTNELQASARAVASPGLFLAIDQEGGRVARLTSNKGFTEFPGAMGLAATARDGLVAASNTRRVGAVLAAEMKAVGLNVNFAPDLDVNNNPANPVIGIRSFGSDPRRVAALGVAFIEGLQAGGVLAFGKHFPGHGDTGTDSHLELPVVGHARARLDAVEFVPFKAAIAAQVAGIMSAHVAFPAIDATPGVPGTLSAKVLSNLLRGDLHFEGLVVTDSLEMGALEKQGFPAPRAAARALASGADVLLFNSGFKLHQAAIAQIVADVRSGAIPMSRLDEAVRQTLRAKARFGLLRPVAVDIEAAAKICASPAHRVFAAELAGAAITVLRDDAGRLPLAKIPAPLVVGVGAGAKIAEGLGGTEVRISEQPTAAEISAALKAVQSHRGAPVIMTLSGANRGQADLARRIVEAGAPTVLVAVREPYDLMFAAKLPARNAPALVATYGTNPVTLEALVAVLRGDAEPAGHLPVDLPGFFPAGAGLDDFKARLGQVVNPRGNAP